MLTTKGDIIAIATLITLFIGSGLLGYSLGKNSPCTPVEDIDIRPMD